jgi:hypothetical protein
MHLDAGRQKADEALCAPQASESDKTESESFSRFPSLATKGFPKVYLTAEK